MEYVLDLFKIKNNYSEINEINKSNDNDYLDNIKISSTPINTNLLNFIENNNNIETNEYVDLNLINLKKIFKLTKSNINTDNFISNVKSVLSNLNPKSNLDNEWIDLYQIVGLDITKNSTQIAKSFREFVSSKKIIKTWSKIKIQNRLIAYKILLEPNLKDFYDGLYLSKYIKCHRNYPYGDFDWEWIGPQIHLTNPDPKNKVDLINKAYSNLFEKKVLREPKKAETEIAETEILNDGKYNEWDINVRLNKFIGQVDAIISNSGDDWEKSLNKLLKKLKLKYKKRYGVDYKSTMDVIVNNQNNQNNIIMDFDVMSDADEQSDLDEQSDMDEPNNINEPNDVNITNNPFDINYNDYVDKSNLTNADKLKSSDLNKLFLERQIEYLKNTIQTIKTSKTRPIRYYKYENIANDLNKSYVNRLNLRNNDVQYNKILETLIKNIIDTNIDDKITSGELFEYLKWEQNNKRNLNLNRKNKRGNENCRLEDSTYFTVGYAVGSQDIDPNSGMINEEYVKNFNIDKFRKWKINRKNKKVSEDEYKKYLDSRTHQDEYIISNIQNSMLNICANEKLCDVIKWTYSKYVK